MTCATNPMPDHDHEDVCIRHFINRGLSSAEARERMKRAGNKVSHAIVTTPSEQLSAATLLNIIKTELTVDGNTPDYWLCFHCLNYIIGKNRR